MLLKLGKLVLACQLESKDTNCMSKAFFTKLSHKRQRDSLAQLDGKLVLNFGSKIVAACINHFGQILSSVLPNSDTHKLAAEKLMDTAKPCIDTSTTHRLDVSFDKLEWCYSGEDSQS